MYISVYRMLFVKGKGGGDHKNAYFNLLELHFNKFTPLYVVFDQRGRIPFL
jgi:hypothetical protein